MENEEKIVGKCHLCEINVYDRGALNKSFKTHLGSIKKGYPKAIALPCGLNRKEGRCPFETKETQDRIEYKKGLGVISGANTWDGIV